MNEKKILTAEEVLFNKDYLEKKQQEKQLSASALLDKDFINCLVDKNAQQKFEEWLENLHVKPYIKCRDLSDPFDDRKNDVFDDGSGSKKGLEIGIKFSF